MEPRRCMHLALAAHHPLLSAFCAKPPVIEHILLHYALKPGIGGKCENAQRMRKGPTGWSFGCKNLQDAEKWPYKAVFW